MTKSFRIIVVVVACFVLPNVSLQANDCTQRWECRRMIDTANCWLRVGPNSSQFKEALSCQGECQCMPDSSTGSLACHCQCYYTYCYEV